MAKRSIRDLLRVPNDGAFELAKVDPRTTPGLPDIAATRRDPKGWSLADLAATGTALEAYQERLFASAKAGHHRRRLLLLLQAMDCGGKDGTVKNVVGQVNPSGVRVASFGVPTPEERRHQFLWRIRKELPPPGYVGAFNRSHYEDVLVVRVHGLVPRGRLERRYDMINEFEREQTDDGLTLLKVMLHISPEEQLARLRARLEDPTKRWKYRPGDLDERARWDDYQEAYQIALTRCNAPPWYVVPADRKWYRNWAVARLLLETFAELDPRYPEPDYDVIAEQRRIRSA